MGAAHTNAMWILMENSANQLSALSGTHGSDIARQLIMMIVDLVRLRPQSQDLVPMAPCGSQAAELSDGARRAMPPSDCVLVRALTGRTVHATADITRRTPGQFSVRTQMRRRRSLGRQCQWHGRGAGTQATTALLTRRLAWGFAALAGERASDQARRRPVYTPGLPPSAAGVLWGAFA